MKVLKVSDKFMHIFFLCFRALGWSLFFYSTHSELITAYVDRYRIVFILRATIAFVPAVVSVHTQTLNHTHTHSQGAASTV